MKKKELNNAGGFVSMDRVEGNLNLSRALGDFSYKQNKELPSTEQMVLNLPEIITETIDKDTEFLIIACDGIWDCMTNQEAVNFIKNTAQKLNPDGWSSFKVSDITSAIFDKNLAVDTFGRGGTGKEGAGWDNMTAVIVMFKHQESTMEVDMETTGDNA